MTGREKSRKKDGHASSPPSAKRSRAVRTEGRAGVSRSLTSKPARAQAPTETVGVQDAQLAGGFRFHPESCVEPPDQKHASSVFSEKDFPPLPRWFWVFPGDHSPPLRIPAVAQWVKDLVLL